MNPVAFYKCLSDDTRLKCLMLIVGAGSLCVCQLTEALELSQPKISRHLAELRKCQLLLDERRGKWVFYSINPDLPQWLKSVMKTTRENTQDYLKPCTQRLERSCIDLSNCC